MILQRKAEAEGGWDEDGEIKIGQEGEGGGGKVRTVTDGMRGGAVRPQWVFKEVAVKSV